MAIDTSLVSEAAEVGLDATAPSAGGKRRFLFLRNRKALAGLGFQSATQAPVCTQAPRRRALQQPHGAH